MTILYKLLGLVVMLLAFAVAILILRSGESNSHQDTSPSVRRSQEDPPAIAVARSVDRFRPDSRPEYSTTGGPNFQLNPRAAVYLDWSVEDLESFLDAQKKRRSGQEFGDLLKSIMPDPAGSNAWKNQLLPGSLSVSEQTRIVIKYVEPEFQSEVLGFLWSKNREGPAFDKYLGEVALHLDHGYVRHRFIQKHISHYFSDFDRMAELLQSENPLENPFPNFIAESGDERSIINGLNPAFVSIIKLEYANKSEVIELITNSNISGKHQFQMINYVNSLAR